jgi:nitrate/nitrite-specific signal transduction histidine kinase
MKTLLLMAMLLATTAQAANETWTVDGKTFESKAQAIRHIMATGKIGLIVMHNRCEILTQKLTFKACPKSGGSMDNMPYTPSEGY